jgi:5-deoxy-glucuronate isomerase
LIVLGGTCDIRSDKGEWLGVGSRADVFSGIAWGVYLPRGTRFTLTASTERFEVAHAWVPTDRDFAPVVVRPDDCRVELRGGESASRQINHIIPPGFPCHRLVSCEVYTPGGNWSSYPPHKHDERRVDADDKLLEADLEEFYYYKIRRAGGYALQRVYTGDRRLDATVAAYTDDIVLVPEGYHPVSAPVGYDCYYLNFLAGSDQSLANTDDPEYAWVKETWERLDPRVPMVT